MDIRLNINPAMRSALLKNQTAAWEAQKRENRARTYSSRDTLELSEEAIAARNAEASKEPTSDADPAPKSFAEQWRAGRKFGILRKEDGSMDDSATTFFWPGDGHMVYKSYLQAQGKPTTGIPWSDYEIAGCQIVRNQISQSVQDLLQKNGVTIPEGQSFTLRVDANYYIHAVGLDDPELAESVEKAINVGNNGYYLQYHISECKRVSRELGLTVPSAADSLSEAKESLLYMVQDLTGYDIRELDREDGNIYTPDGQNLWDVLLEKAAHFQTPDGINGIDISQYWLIYSRIAALGWDSIPDPVYELLYMDGNLYDIGTEYGYGPGQTDWQEWAHANAATLSANAIAGIDRQIAENEARSAAQAQSAHMPPKAARAAEPPEKPEETEAPEEPVRDLRLEDMDLENTRVPRTLVFLGESEPIPIAYKAWHFSNGKSLIDLPREQWKDYWQRKELEEVIR